MRRQMFGLMVASLLFGVNLYAGEGDLIVKDNLGVGTAKPILEASTPNARILNIRPTTNYGTTAVKLGSGNPTTGN